MTGYLLFALFLAFVIFMARPQREDKVYPASEQVKEEYRRYLAGEEPEEDPEEEEEK